MAIVSIFNCSEMRLQEAQNSNNRHKISSVRSKLFRLSSGQWANNRYKQGVCKIKTSENATQTKKRGIEAAKPNWKWLWNAEIKWKWKMDRDFPFVCAQKGEEEQTKRNAAICDCSIKCNNVRMQERTSSKVDKIAKGSHWIAAKLWNSLPFGIGKLHCEQAMPRDGMDECDDRTNDITSTLCNLGISPAAFAFPHSHALSNNG